MTPNSPSSSDGSALPPRHRPNMGNLSKDTTEQDLWAFDDLDSADEEIPEEPAAPAGPTVPSIRDSGKSSLRQDLEPPSLKIGGPQDSVKVNVSKNRPKVPAGPLAGQSKPGAEFDDLDHWEEPTLVPPVSKSSPDARTPHGVTDAPPQVIAAEIPPPATQPDPQDEFSPVARDQATPVSLRPRLNLSRIERLGLVALTVLLLIGATVVFLNSIHRLPTGSDRVMADDFPIVGKHLSVATADTFWRAPKTADTVRRGTQLIPVVDLTSSGGPAAIRVFFRNSDGDVIGDAVTRFLQPGNKLQIAATAGFDDVGMHAAYRTGENKPWTIEVFEAPTESAPGPDFRKLFEMDIATDRR